MNSNSSDNVRDLEEYCTSMSISLDILQEKISDVSSPTALSCSHFLHTLVLNENITLSMVELVLQIYPYAAYLCSNRFIVERHHTKMRNVHRYEAENNEGRTTPTARAKKKCSDRAYPIFI